MKNENISAFLDGELDGEDLDAVLTELQSDDTRDEVLRLTAARAAMSGSNPALRSIDISRAVAESIRSEPVPSPNHAGPPKVVSIDAAPARQRPGWLMPAGGLALAASVVMAAVVLQIVPQAEQGAAPPVTVAAAPSADAEARGAEKVAGASAPATAPMALAATRSPRPSIPGAMTVAAGGNRDSASRELVIAAPSASRPDPGSQLSSYLINHARYGGGYAMNGPLSYARVAAYREDAIEKDKR